MILSHQVYKMLRVDVGIKTSDVCKIVGKSQSVVSGILSHLKLIGKVTNVENMWYVLVMDEKVREIKEYLSEVSCDGEVHSSWAEGFVVGLNYAGVIGENEYNVLMEWLVS